jgi:V/A-type H+-transporting ATPase subunit E
VPEIESFYEAQAQREYDDLMREGKQDGELQLKRLTGAAAMEAKKTILSMKQRAVDAVLKASIERICDLSDEQYRLSRKACRAAAFTGTEEVIFNRRDCKSGVARNVVAKANDLLKKRKLLPKLTVSSENGSFAGGIIVKQGDIEVNCTVEKLVETNRDRLASDIAAVLFAE